MAQQTKAAIPERHSPPLNGGIQLFRRTFCETGVSPVREETGKETDNKKTRQGMITDIPAVMPSPNPLRFFSHCCMQAQTGQSLPSHS